MEAKILEFPKNKSWRVRMGIELKEKKAVISISLVSVIAATLIVNQWIARVQNASIMNSAELTSLAVSRDRGIASIQDNKSLLISLAEQIKKEQELAHRISTDDISAGVMAQALTAQDHLIYEVLQGKYGISKVEGKINRVEFVKSENSLPIVISDKVGFLEKHNKNFNVNYTKVNLDKNMDNNKETYRLFDGGNKLVGLAEFSLDSEGRVLSLDIQNK